MAASTSPSNVGRNPLDLGPAQSDVLFTVDLAEQTLRDTLATDFGQRCGQAIFDRVLAGETVLLAMADGSTLTLTDPLATTDVLRELFGWTCESLFELTSPTQA